MQEEINNLKREFEDKVSSLSERINELESYKSDREKEQLRNPLDEVTQALIDRNSGSKINLGSSSTEVTISSGAINITGSFHSVDTEGDASTDDLDNINGDLVKSGDILVLNAASSSRSVVLKDATGNLRLAGDFTLDNNDDMIVLVKDAGAWKELSRSDNAA